MFPSLSPSVRWNPARRRGLGAAGALGAGLRAATLLVFAAYFAVPVLWLLLAPSKDPTQLYKLHPLAFGSWERFVKAWHNVTAYQNGAIWLWFRNSVVYVVSSLAVGLATSI